MQINKYTSDKIKVISFISIILVLYIHSGFHDIPSEIQGMKTNYYLQEAISVYLGRIAVPIFFMISGMLFFRNTNCIEDIFRKMKKRCKTLLIPFLIAGLYLPAVYLTMRQIPWTKQFINSFDIFSNVHSFGSILQSLYLFTPTGNQPWGFHLWFLRDLIIIIALSPILYFARKKLGHRVIVTLLFTLTFIPLKFGIFTSLFWFMAGDFLLLKLSYFKSLLLTFIYLSLSICQLLRPSVYWSYFIIPISLIGVMALWSKYDYLFGKDFRLKGHSFLKIVCNFTFFIYLYHEPTINILRKIMIIILGRSSFGFALNYILAPWIFALIAALVGQSLKNCVPKIYETLAGDR